MYFTLHHLKGHERQSGIAYRLDPLVVLIVLCQYGNSCHGCGQVSRRHSIVAGGVALVLCYTRSKSPRTMPISFSFSNKWTFPACEPLDRLYKYARNEYTLNELHCGTLSPIIIGNQSIGSQSPTDNDKGSTITYEIQGRIDIGWDDLEET